MKKQDIAMIVLVTGVSILIAYFVSVNVPFLRVPEAGVDVHAIKQIEPDIDKLPSSDVFHPSAINPTVQVVVGSD